eukprot:130353-Prymnesium_polylepis.1
MSSVFLALNFTCFNWCLFVAMWAVVEDRMLGMTVTQHAQKSELAEMRKVWSGNALRGAPRWAPCSPWSRGQSTHGHACQPEASAACCGRARGQQLQAGRRRPRRQSQHGCWCWRTGAAASWGAAALTGGRACA